MVNSHHTTVNRERIIATQQAGAPIPFRKILNAAVFTALSLIKNGKENRMPKLVKRGEEMRAEAEEQLKLLNLCEFLPEFDAEALRRAIDDFDAETQRMKVQP